MKKVLILVENFRVGGGQYVVHELAKNLDTSHIQFKIVCYTARKGTELEKKMESIADVEYLNIDGHVGLLKYRKVMKAINAYNPDIIHAHLSAQIFSIVWSWIYKKPSLITAHTVPQKAFLKKTEWLLKKEIKRGKQYVVAVSDKNAEMMKEYFGVGDDRCFCVNNGIDIDSFYRVPHEHFTFINVATHNENKNQSAIIRCFAKLVEENPDIRLILAGDGVLHNELIELSKELNVYDKIEFPGSVSEVQKYNARADVYVQSSHREAMPLAVLEAMAASLPIVATNVGGLPDIVKDNGFLVNDDEEELCAAMREMLLVSEDKLKEFGINSRRMVEKYSSKEMAKKYMEIYEFICQTK